MKQAFLIAGIFGLALLCYMVAVEGEPGLLPIALVVVGFAGYGWMRMRSSKLNR